MKSLFSKLQHPIMEPCLTFVVFGIAGAMLPFADAAPSLDEIREFHAQKGREDAAWLVRQNLAEPDAALSALMERRMERLNYSLMQDGMRLSRDAVIHGRARHDERIVRAAAEFADAVLRKHVTPSGAFVEYDRNTWLKPEEMWRTIPWGTAFCGNRAFEAWMELKGDFTPEQRAFWSRELQKTGAWIHRNPVVGGYVFNNVIDLCALLWRIGREFNRPEWCRWALEVAEGRIRRDVDEEGWILGESGGASGAYQLIGARYLSTFAWEAKAPVLEEAVRRIFAKSALPYATPTLDWTGNFGTRVSDLRRLPGELLLVAAALGDPQAAYCVQTYGQPEWSHELALWEKALAQRGVAPTYAPVTKFKGIASTVVREGPWVAYFGNYNKSIWAHGFASLWHAGHGDWVFSTLNSLHLLSTTEKAKTRVSDLSDWAGFPHVRVTQEDRQYDSHKRIDTIETTTGDGVTVNWTEPLLDETGQPGGEMRSSYRFHGPEIELTIELRDLAGESQLDFHFMRRPNGFIRLWAGNDVADIFAGRLLRSQGTFDDRTLKPGQPKLYGVQVDRTTFGFEVLSAPARATLTLVGETPSALHTMNLGGFRFRIAAPATERNFTIKLRLRAVP